MIRGILEEPEQPGDPEGLVGMIGSLEYAIHSDRLDGEGEIWLPKTSPKEDPSVGRSVSGCSLELLGPGATISACLAPLLSMGAFKGLPPLLPAWLTAVCWFAFRQVGDNCTAVQAASIGEPPVGRHGPDCLL